MKKKIEIECVNCNRTQEIKLSDPSPGIKKIMCYYCNNLIFFKIDKNHNITQKSNYKNFVDCKGDDLRSRSIVRL